MEISDLKTQVITDLLSQLTFPQAKVAIDQVDGGLSVVITVDEVDSGILIGHHGEKIDALQLVINLILNQNNLVYTPVQVDINGYRQRRKQSLEDLANKAASKAIDSGREILLPHLPSYERRIIHMYLQGRPDVTTYSEGEGEDRRLVVRPTTQEAE
jgi:spoIIIJ-associated protein